MRDNLRNVFGKTYFFEWYYILVILAYIATIISGAVRPGVFAVALMCIVAVQLAVTKKMNIHSVMDVLIVVYFLYRLMTIVCIRRSGMPISVYFGEVAVSLIPMIFYFAGSKAEDRKESFYSKFLIILCVLGVISFIMYVIAPQFYADYLYNWSYISKADASTVRVRMQSFTGCTVFGAIMILGMAVSSYFMCAEGEDKEIRQKRRFGLLAFALTFLFAIMSNQRSCLVAAIVIVLYVAYLVFAHSKSIPKRYIIFAFAALFAVFVLISLVRFDFILKIWWRLESLPGAISQRSEQWVAAVNNMYSSWFGNGLGANGHKALGIDGAHVIADGGLIKLYCEEGVLGFSLFAYILFITVKKAIVNIANYYAELCLIISVLVLSIGSNVLAFQLVTPIFWYGCGRIWAEYDKKDSVDFKMLFAKKEN